MQNPASSHTPSPPGSDVTPLSLALTLRSPRQPRDHGYTGHLQDAASGLTYMQQRYYDPQGDFSASRSPRTRRGESTSTATGTPTTTRSSSLTPMEDSQSGMSTKVDMRKIRWLLMASLGVAVACSSHHGHKTDAEILHAGGFDLLSVVFKIGEPAVSGNSSAHIYFDPDVGVEEILSQNLAFIKSKPHVEFHVLGWTDDRECVDDKACLELSRRRASFMTSWYQAQGARNLGLPEGCGIYPASLGNPSESARRISRRAELWVGSEKFNDSSCQKLSGK